MYFMRKFVGTTLSAGSALQRSVRIHKMPLTLHQVAHFEAASAQESRPFKDLSIPDESWTPEAVAIYNKLNRLTEHPTWVRFPGYANENKVGNRMFLRAVGNKQFMYALFLNVEEKCAKGVMTFGPWAEGAKEHVHGGACATVLDSIMGVLSNVAVAPSVTANLNVDYVRPLKLGQAVLVDASLRHIDGRKIYLDASITNIDKQTYYVKATSLFIKTKKRVDSEFMNE